MEILNVNPNEFIFSLDIGTRSIIGTVGVLRDKKFKVICEKYLEHEERAMMDGQIHDITLVANAVNKVKEQLENEIGTTLKNVSIAAAGRFLRTSSVKVEIETDGDVDIHKEMIRSLELTAIKKAQDEINKNTEGKLYCVGYSVKSYFLNGYVISNLESHKGESIGAEVIATFLPRSVVDSLYAVMNKVNLKVENLTLEPIAAMEAAVPQKLRLLNIALVDIGAGTSDIAISSRDSIVAYGMVPLAGDEVTEVIAQNYLVDFNTAERIKKESTKMNTIKYVDALGFENEVESEEIIKVVAPVVDKIAKGIADKLIELNGGKTTNAVFLVGGGSHTPTLKEKLVEKLNLPLNRIAIKDREAVEECICTDNSLGSIGVTVLGIALVTIKNSGHDFIDVTLNGKVYSLFNSHKHIIMDVIMQAGIDPNSLIGKNGKNTKFTLNGVNRVAFGDLGKNAVIKINGVEGNLDTVIKEGDNIDITYAMEGEKSKPIVKDYVNKITNVSFYLDGQLINLEPKAYINDVEVDFDNKINENDKVEIIYPETLGDFIRMFKYKYDECEFLLQGQKLEKNHIIKEGQQIVTEKGHIVTEDIIKKDEIIKDESLKQDTKGIEVRVIVNNNPITLQGKENYIFIDIFDYIDFDLTRPKGSIILILNEKKAGYYDKLHNGDEIKIYWE